MRLLVVEDESDLLQTLALALREEGYAIDTSADGIEGLYKAENWDYDLLILDVMLPGQDGWTVLKQLRNKKATPVLMLTARDTVDDRIRGLDGGADDYLTKPFDIDELLARVRALIRRSAGKGESQTRIGDVVVDHAARTVSSAGTPVAVTPREYALIDFLAVHRGEVITRTTLYEHLFDESDDSISNLLDVHVSKVRKKLGRDFIQTRRGHGYLIP